MPEPSALRHVRLGGLLYLAIILLGLFGELGVRGALTVPGDAAATAQAIAAAPGLWRAGIAADLLMHVLDLPVILVLYWMLKPVDKGLAQLATAFNLVQTAVLAANKLHLLLPLFLLGDAAYLAAFSPQQLHALVALAVRAHAHGFAIGLVFFGVACLLRGWLILRSDTVPRVLGGLLALAGAAYLVNSMALLLAPGLAAQLFPGILVPAFVAELSLSLWMMAQGSGRPASTPP